jgi:hypothetical protein
VSWELIELEPAEIETHTHRGDLKASVSSSISTTKNVESQDKPAKKSHKREGKTPC